MDNFSNKAIEFIIEHKKAEIIFWQTRLEQRYSSSMPDVTSSKGAEEVFNVKEFWTRKEIRERLPIWVSTSTIIRDLKRHNITPVKEEKTYFRSGKAELHYQTKDVILAFSRYWKYKK